ncbi:unnamed protein product [Jaminaea pallidilutea]
MSALANSKNDSVRVTKSAGAVFEPGKPSVEGPAPGEIVIKNVAVASNPKDWKMAKMMGYEGIEGNDVAGHVAAVGDGVTEFKEGDKVGAFTVMATADKYGAYQRYSHTPAHTAFHIGSNTSYEQAATLPLAVLTAAIGLFAKDKLALQEPTAQAKPASSETAKQIVVVWGASSSVGAFVTQLAKLAGYHVIGVASGSKDYARQLGADDIVDYKTEKAIPQALLTVAGGRPIVAAYDAISEHGSTQDLVSLFEKQGEAQKGRLTTVLPTQYDQDKSGLPNHVYFDRTFVGAAHKDQSDFSSRWIRQISKWVDEGTFKPNRVEIVSGGLKGVPEGLAKLESGKVSGVKLVYRIEETPA